MVRRPLVVAPDVGGSCYFLLGELRGDDLAIDRAGRQQLAVRAHAHHVALIQHDDAVRMVEANAAGVYWGGWNIGIWWKDREVPPHWRTFEQRASDLSRSGRHATHPVNAMLNYGYAVLAGMTMASVLALNACSIELP